MEIYGYIWQVNTYINKGIYEVQYNLIGLPSKTHFFNGNIIYTDYAADGRKLQTRYVYDSNEVAVIETDGGDEISGSGDLDGLFGSMAAVGGSVAQSTDNIELDLNTAHKKASKLEGKVTGYYISPYSRNFSPSGVSVFNVDFPKNSGKVILYHSNNNLLYILHNR